jgi:hypothetical protein
MSLGKKNKMAFVANEENDFELWDYILGDIYQGMSIAVDRYQYLQELDNENELKLAFRDPITNNWTKWGTFPGLLWEHQADGYGGQKYSRLTAAVDVHRSVLSNEIVIEADYPTYEENYDAAKLIGKIIEEKGFQPLYYYSGNKSIHVHVFLDWDCMKNVDPMTMDNLRLIFKSSKLRFQKKFMEWLRTKMITCWDTNAKKFDTDLIRATHLIRCELSKNKQGFKTFLGYTHKDMSFVPYICNEKNRIYPKLGKIKLSIPKCTQELMEEFIEDIRVKAKSEIVRKRNRTLSDWGSNKISPESLRTCVKAILSDDFKKAGDGFKRGMFILLNELRRVFDDDQARVVINDWNERMGMPVEEKEIAYRFKLKNYSLSCDYIHKFLKEVGMDISKKCKGKVYK